MQQGAGKPDSRCLRKAEKTEIEGDPLFYTAEGVWEHEPFPGDIAGGKVWGRGAADRAFWQEICGSRVRFAPVVYGSEQMKGMRGLNGNVSVDCLPGAVACRKNLIGLSE